MHDRSSMHDIGIRQSKPRGAFDSGNTCGIMAARYEQSRKDQLAQFVMQKTGARVVHFVSREMAQGLPLRRTSETHIFINQSLLELSDHAFRQAIMKELHT